MKIVFVVDLDRCIGCKGCQVACKMENDIALGVNRNTVRQVGPIGTYPNLEMYFLPTMCQQCDNPACVNVCPTGACYKNPEDGVVLIDTDMCIGCESCKNACPYDAITENRELRTMDKCTLCVQLRKEGETPACVRNCAGKALHVGDIDDPNSEVSRLIAEAGEEHVFTFRDMGCQPNTRYILRKGTWQDVLPKDCSIPGRRRTF